MLIGGRWVPASSGTALPVVDPATGQEVTQVPLADAGDVDRAVAAARRAFDEGSWQLTTAAERSGLLLRLADLVEEHGGELARTEAVDSGKPLAVVQSCDIPLAVDVLRRVASWAGQARRNGRTAPALVPGTVAYQVLAPAGVVGLVTPWAFPLLMAVWQLAPAIAAGSTVVLKPAEQTPLSALRLGELSQEAGLPDGVFNIVTGRNGAAVRLVTNPAVDKVVFTGCTELGRQLARAAAANPRKAALRIGGRAPLVIYRDADIGQAVAQATTAGFFSHFQTCTTGARLYAEKDIYPEVVAAVAERADQIRVGPALEPASQLGPLVSAEHVRRTAGFLAASRAAGALAATGGGRRPGQGYFVEPTVLTGLGHDAALAAADITGPVLPVLAFSDVREITAPAGAGIHGCAAGVWTSDMTKARQTAAIVHASTMWVNSYRIYDTALPFGEPRHAGWGPEILDDYLDSRSIIARTAR
jgi:phenylacetaldehyde dehydrogenase